MHDTLIIGGGCVGLSLAWELAQRGQRVQVIDRGEFGQEASQAAAGIFPPAVNQPELPIWVRLRGLSHELHAQWSTRLRDVVGIDNGFRVCGGIHLAQSFGEGSAMLATAAQMKADGIAVEMLTPEQLARLEPCLPRDVGRFSAAMLLPKEACIHGPSHLKALQAACQTAGVERSPATEAQAFQLDGDRVIALSTNRGDLSAGHYCITAGAWSEPLAAQLGLNVSIYPVRGQIICYQIDQPLLSRIVNVGPRYLLSRDDGCLLAGSTEEDVGFDKRNTAEGIAELKAFAESLLPELATAEIVQTWAGLRPQSIDGYPYLGRVPHLTNATVAAGHYRSGLHLSTGTAVVMAAIILGENPPLDVTPFALQR